MTKPNFTETAVLLSMLSLANPEVFAKDKKQDPEEIGNRDVGKKEIAIGQQMAKEAERQAKVIDDAIIAEYVNRIAQNLVRNSDAKVPFTIKSARLKRSERVCATRRLLFREHRPDFESR